MKVKKIKETLEELGYSVISACNQIIEIEKDGRGYFLGEITAPRRFDYFGKVVLPQVNEDDYRYKGYILGLRVDLIRNKIPFKN
jgi:hypothetical protein